MTVDLVVITDGRGDYLEQAIDSAREHLDYRFTQRIMVDDSGEPRYTAWLREQYPEFKVLAHPQRRGLAAAVQTGWQATSAEYVFHLEEDFTFNQHVDIEAMRTVLRGSSCLAQVVLKRQAWSREEKAAGGIVEMHPNQYVERRIAGHVVTAHRRIFSLNPCLIPRDVIDIGWPASNEAGFTAACLVDGWEFAFIGARFDPPVVTHIGERRTVGWTL